MGIAASAGGFIVSQMTEASEDTQLLLPDVFGLGNELCSEVRPSRPLLPRSPPGMLIGAFGARAQVSSDLTLSSSDASSA